MQQQLIQPLIFTPKQIVAIEKIQVGSYSLLKIILKSFPFYHFIPYPSPPLQIKLS